MPIYEYFCESCDHIFEKFQKITDSSNSICTKCNVNIAKRKISVSAFHLKGGGWFKDGYGREGKPYTNILSKKISHYDFFKVT